MPDDLRDRASLAALDESCAFRSRRRHEPNVGEGIDQAGIHGETFAIDHPGFLRKVDVFADGGNDAVRDDHGAVFDARAGDGHDGGAANGERLRLASLALRRDSVRRRKQTARWRR